MPSSNNSDVIVYLLDYQKSGDSIYDLELDFRTGRDFEAFKMNMQNLLPETNEIGSILLLGGVYHPIRLVRGAYYKLDVGLLSDIMGNTETPSSYLIAYSIRISDNDNKQKENNRLLHPHEPLDPKELHQAPTDNLAPLSQIIPQGFSYIKIKVNDVGQANWNELQVDGNTKLVYDLGAPLRAGKSQVDQYVATYAPTYTQNKPILVISHWDMDHIHCLLSLKGQFANYFSAVIAPNKLKSNTASALSKELRKELHNAFFLIKNPYRTIGKEYPQVHEKYAESNIKLFIGETSRNINYSGIIAFIKGPASFGVLTGDSMLSQVNDIYHKEICHTDKDMQMVVPHHGGDFSANKYKQFSLNEIGSCCAISVGRGNTYGHPSQKMLHLLSSWFQNIKRTDTDSTVVMTL